MSENLLRQRQIQCHQHDRPVNGMETQNILAYQMQICRPVFFKHRVGFFIQSESQTGDIVGQCIDPYINHMFRIKVYGNTPGERSSGNTQILKTCLQEVVHHLILSGSRLNKFRMFLNILNQTVCIFAHSEEISLFLRRLYFPSAVGTLSVHQL